jgi:SAM-dependent methyltransferase
MMKQFWAIAGARDDGEAPGKLCIPAAERNRDPILAVLRRILPERARVVEVGSGTGQHAAHFTGQWPTLTWQPTEMAPVGRASIEAYRQEGAPDRFLAPVEVDVTRDPLPGGPWDGVFSANVIHIAPWEVCVALVRAASRVVGPGGYLMLYGPFRFSGSFTAPSNAEFDARLRGADPSWGVRDVEDVAREARSAGFGPPETHEMPANNHILAFRRGG